MTASIHAALSEALSHVADPNVRRLIRHAHNAIVRDLQRQLDEERDRVTRYAVMGTADRTTLPAPKPSLAQTLTASIEDVERRKTGT